MSGNKNVVPEAREALNRFKMEAASEVGVNLQQGYNGHLTSKEASSVGGQMVKSINPYELYNSTAKAVLPKDIKPPSNTFSTSRHEYTPDAFASGVMFLNILI